ncbi:HNH endonuclease [Chishuiella changwenlii]|nr:HNH endonuclease [Chishuiella changwenlii]
MANLETVKKLNQISLENISFQRKELKNDKKIKDLEKQKNDTNLNSNEKSKINNELNELLNLNTYLESVFNYSERKDRLILYYSKREASNCHYCLAQYTTIYTGKMKMYLNGNLDHIYPKSKNALISVSLNNLIPVCSLCNQRKSDATDNNFNFNPFDNHQIPKFNFKNVIDISNGEAKLNKMDDLIIDNINPTLESRLELTSLYKEYKSPIVNLLDRYKKFNSPSYKMQISKLTEKDISDNLESFISETSYTDKNIQNIPLHKFKSDFYKELEEYKSNGDI